jgi:radical SAM superfamily enzyme YgiQ (UPF0313 family)
MLDLLLVHPPITDFSKKRVIKDYLYELQLEPPLGLCYIGAVLEKNNYKVRILDMDILKMSSEGLLRIINYWKPKMIGFSVNSANYDLASRFCEIIKKNNSNIPIIFGGVHACYFPEQCINEPFVDYVGIGEGEYLTLELLNCLFRNEGKIENINGLIYKNKDNKISRNLPRKVESNLDNFPYPARHLLLGDVNNKYFSVLSKKSKIATIVTSRGCPYNCSFCSKIFSSARLRSIENVMGEIQFIQEKYKLNDFQIMDSTFNLNRKKNIEFCQNVIERNLDIHWRARCRPDLMNRKLLYYYKKANCYVITYGAESGSDRILRFLKKQYTTDQIRRTFALTDQFGIETHALFMMGIPGETTADILKTIRFSKEIMPNYLQIATYVPFPGTYIFDLIKKHHLYQDKPLMYMDYSRNQIPILNLPNLSAKVIKRLLKFNYLTYILKPRFSFKFLKSIINNPWRFPGKALQLLEYFFQ